MRDAGERSTAGLAPSSSSLLHETTSPARIGNDEMVHEPTPPLSISNRYPSLLPGPGFLHHLVQPSNTAAVAIDFLEHGSRRQLTYDHLHALSDHLAKRIVHSLSVLGQASPVVPIFLPQCPELYIAMLAILKAGRAFCPLNLDTPRDRLEFMLGDLSSQLIITSSTCQLAVLDGISVQLLLVDQEPVTAHPSPGFDLSPIETTDLAYVLYTSGSTGLPKAVPLSHRAVTQSLLAHDRHIPHFDRFLQFAAPTFDVSIFEIFFPLLRGKTLVGCSRSDMLSDLPSIIQELKVDAVELTPTVAGSLLNGRNSVPGLKLLLTIGEMLTKHVVDEFGATPSRPGILWGLYGPTEAAIHCTVQPNFQCQSPVGNIGRPLDTVSAFIMEHTVEGQATTNMSILPCGQVGELVLGGHQLADGYLNRDELTAAAFVQHPDFGLLYRTGDKARMAPDGTLECLGRIISGQIKLRGQRVELGEIEQAILRVAECRSTTVMVVDDCLVAFCAVGSSQVTSETIKETCKRWLPSYMVPADIVLLLSMPQLSSGKINKGALRSQYYERKRLTEQTSVTEHSSSIQNAVEHVLGRRVPVNASLSALGLDSLRSIRVASILRKNGYDVAASDVLSAEHIVGLLAMCESKKIHNSPSKPTRRNGFRKPSLDVHDLLNRSKEIEEIIFCTPLQTAMLADTLFRPRAYCNWVEIEVESSYSFDHIREMILRLAQDNEIIRTGFSVGSTGTETFAQVIWKRLDESQITHVTYFSRDYALISKESLLRPFRVQINTTFKLPHILLQIHHALYDGWSMDLLLLDLRRLLSGKPPKRRPQYREVVAYYLRGPHEPDYKEHVSFWANSLRGYQPPHFPNFNGRTGIQSSPRALIRKAAIDFQMLSSRAQDCLVNPQVFFQAALLRMMAFILGSSDVVIGTVTSGRTIGINDIEEILGPCIASLPLRFDFSQCSTVEDMLQRVQKANRDIVKHCTLPLRDISNMCGVRPGTPLFDVLFVWQQSLFSDVGSPQVKIVNEADKLDYKLTLAYQPMGDHVQVKATYDPSVIPESQVQHLLHQIDDIVRFLLLDSHKLAADVVECFSPQHLSIANPNPISKRFTHGPAYAVEQWAQRAPEREALIFGTAKNGQITATERLTYAALNGRANKLAHALAEQGARNNELICVIMEKSLDLYVAILAVLKLGCGYLPIVPDSPAERASKIVGEARVSLCISDTSVSKELLSQLPCTIFHLDWSQIWGYPEQDINTTYDGSRLAYAVFTSGSTGKPKGVLVTQDNLMSNLDYLHGRYPTSETSRLLQACSQAFDVSVFEIFFAWYAGICLCSAKKDDLFCDLEQAMNTMRITHLSLTPTVASLVNPRHVPSIEFLVTAGEALTEHVRRQWAGKGLYQGYGPSETTNICTVRGPFTTEDLINNIGAPFDNTSVLVMEPERQVILPRGAIGELCFGGAQVFRGYLNMPELNKRKIIDHPEYGRIYRSGDMGMLLPDNSILFTGRSDDQVKIRGQRVELGEITSIILDSAAVEDCATLLVQSNGRNPKLVSYWVPTDASSHAFEVLANSKFISATAGLFESLELKLPSYMIPTQLLPISQIPLTAQSKIDKIRLYSALERLSSDLLESISYNASKPGSPEAFTDSERKIAEAFSKAVGVRMEDISRTASLFSLGLDSVSAIQFSRLLRGIGMVNITVSSVLGNPSVARLAQLGIVGSEETSIEKASPRRLAKLFSEEFRCKVEQDYAARNLQVEKILPCTSLQEAMLTKTSATGSSSYCNTMIFSVSGDIYRLQKCWTEMFKRHEILRTAFVPTDDAKYAFAQVVLGFTEMAWEELDSSDDVDAFVKKGLTRLLHECMPPVKVAYRRSVESNHLVFSCHHALYDGTAIGILLQEIEQSYCGAALVPTVPYEHYLQHMIGQDLSAADQFWGRTLADLEPTLFPRLSGAVSGHGAATSYSSFTMDIRPSLSEITRSCQKASVSMLPVVQMVWAKLLQYYTGQEDVCFGNVVSGRVLPGDDLDRLVAPCFNTLPVRVKFNSDQRNADMLRVLHAFNIESLPHQLTPLRRILSIAKQGTGVLFDTLVILQQPQPPLDSSLWALEEDLGTMDVPVVCELSQDTLHDTLRLTLHYDTSLLTLHDASIVAETFDHTLQNLMQNPEAQGREPIGFPPNLLALSNPEFSIIEPKSGPFLHSGFEEQAAAHPDHIALIFQHDDSITTVWTYEELNKRANRIATALVESEVRVGDIVPIHMLKSPEFYASILGTLKAGAAFTPFQPDLPVARKRFMLSELGAKVILCVGGSCSDWCGDVPTLDVGTVGGRPKGDPPCPQGLAPSSLAYCLYTSGSTGVPKAVSMEHKSPIQTIEASRTVIPWTRGSRLLQYAATTFDMCYYDCFLAWTCGFTLCAADQSAMFNNISGIIGTLKVDLLDLTPSVAASLKRVELPSVRWLYCIGEAMTPELVEEWEGACVNSYGPTEAAFCTTIYPVNKERNHKIIGKPFPTVSFAVYAGSGERVLPIFGLGELYIGGAQLAQGYHNRPELTDEKFVVRDDTRLYKSGDMVRMLSDGTFEFMGRVDDQVKIRGLRVELGEIDTVVLKSDARISSATTQILKKDTLKSHQLVTFIVPTGGMTEENHSDLRCRANKAAEKYLPAYMVPQFYIFLDRIPTSAAGKIEKKALDRIFSSTTDLAPGRVTDKSHQWTKMELQIREVFAKISATPFEDISPETTIYELGLDSISAVQVATTLRNKGLHVTVTDVLKYMNCTNLATYLNQHPGSPIIRSSHFDFVSFDANIRATTLERLGIIDEDVSAIRPCTPVQCGMISQLLATNGSAYFNYIRLRLRAGIDQSRLQGAWEAVMTKHEMLRTGFTHTEDKDYAFAMITYAQHACTLPWHTAVNDELSSEEWLARAASSTVENLHQPPWRIRYVKKNGEQFLDLAIFHAIFDAHSLQAIFSEVSHAYDAPLHGEAPSVEPVIDTIINLSKSETTKSAQYWKELGKGISLNRFPNLTPLAEDPAKPAVVSRISTTSLAELEAAGGKSNVTLQAVGIAGWVSILSAYTGETSATCGVVLSGRNFDQANSAVFPCITTVPFTCTVSDDKGKLLKEVMMWNAEVQQHQFMPLNHIQRLMGFPSEPLFDTLFTYQKTSSVESQHDLWSVADEKATIEYPISIELEPKSGHLELRLTFLPHIIPEAQAATMLDQLDHLIGRLLFHSDSTSEENFDAALYAITPPKEQSLPSEVRLLHEFVEHTASQFPDRIALEYATSISGNSAVSHTWTYAELDSQGNRVANLLLSHGTKPGGLVGICFDKCPEAYFAILGILKAGCAFVALDPLAPIARRMFIVEDSGAHIVLSAGTLSEDLSNALPDKVLKIEHEKLGLVDSTKPILSRSIDPQDCSYCLYTSGTTGTPKGCEITHENAVQAMLSFQRIFAGHWNEDSRWLQFASFHFDVSVLEQFWSWSVGIRLVSAPRDLIFEDLARTINVLGITHIDLTPSLARLLHPEDVRSLCRGVFITGGESLKQEILDVWGPVGVIYNGYGPTEATIGVTMYPRVPVNGKPSNIGPQFDNVGSFVLRPGSDTPVLRGAVGELCVSGKLVGKGYLNRPELTEERFAYLPRFNERVYRTGDLVRILYDGTFDFLGRADDQVKLRGQRLEIGEINSVIKGSGAAISDVATLVLKHPEQQKEQLVTFLVTASAPNTEPRILLDGSGNVEVAREACRQKLPGYMVPTHFVTLSAMPLSANNKADHRRLKEMYSSLSVGDVQLLSGIANTQDEKWSSDEEKIRRILQDMLHIYTKEIKKSTSLFELGLDSISVIAFSRSLKQAGFSKATVSAVMGNSTIDRLGKALGAKSEMDTDRGSILAAQQRIIAMQHRHRRAVAESLSVESRDIEMITPCTPLQEGIIARSLESEHGLYYNAFYLNIHGSTAIENLKSAWHRAYSRIQILRTVFANTDDGYMQVVLRRRELPWAECSVSDDKSVANRLVELKMAWWRSNRDIIHRPFELQVVTASGRTTLAIHIFHALYDGISIDLLLKSVWEIFNEREMDVGPDFHSILPYGPLRLVKGAQEFWRTHLSETTSRLLSNGSTTETGRAITLRRELLNWTGYDRLRRRLNITAQAVAQACWATVLRKHLNGDITLGLVVSGRSIDSQGAESVIGPMFNTLPYQHRVRNGTSWATMIKQAHDFNIAAHPYQHTPLRDIVKWTNRSSREPLFDNLLVYQVADNERDWVKNSVWKLESSEAEADYPLALEVEQCGEDVFRLTLVAQENILDAEAAGKLLDGFGDALKLVFSDPDAIVEADFATKDDTLTYRPRPEINGSAVSGDGAGDFEWTTAAKTLKEEISVISGADERSISETTSILELGLDSIDAIKLSSRLKKRGIKLPVSAIMRGLTIKKMNKELSRIADTESEGPADAAFENHKKALEAIVQQNGTRIPDVERILPPTPLQEAMVAEMLASGYARYYNHAIFEVGDHVDLEKLKGAWMRVVQESPILRTSFVEIEDPAVEFSFAQVVHRNPHDLLLHTKVDSAPDFNEIIATTGRQTREPLFHVNIIESPGRTYLLLTVAHALYDGWSLGLLHSDIHRAYLGEFKPRPDFEPALKSILTSSGPVAAAYWKDFLSGARPSLFRSRADCEENIVHRLEKTSRRSVDEIVAFAKGTNITLQALAQTVYALALGSHVRSLDVTFGSVLSGRDDEQMSEVLFPTMNTVANRVILHGTRREMAQYVQQNIVNIKQWQHFPLRKAQVLASRGGPLFNSLFIFQKAMGSRPDGKNELYTAIDGRSDVEYPVCVELEIVDDAFVWRCAIKDEVFNESGAVKFLETLDGLLMKVLEQPDAPVVEFAGTGTSICGLAPFRDDRDAHQEHEAEVETSTAAVNPESTTLNEIREVLAMVSSIPEQEIRDDLSIFHIGLDSISAIKVSALLRKRSIKLSVGEMLKAGTIVNMARIVDERQPRVEDGAGVANTKGLITEALGHMDHVAILRQAGVDEESIEHVMPTTAGQNYMLSVWINSKGALFYPEFEYRIDGDVSFDVLARAWQALTAANSVLRTYILATGDSRYPWIQAILKDSEPSVTDVTGLGNQAVVNLIEQRAPRQPFVHLFLSRSSVGWDLRLKIHHALYDGVSLPLLIQQFQDASNGLQLPHASQDAFYQFVAASISPSAHEQRKTFWTSYLAGLDQDQHFVAQPSTPPTSRTEVFRPDLVKDIHRFEDLGRKHGISFQSLFLAAYARLDASLTRTPGDKEVVVGIYLANRASHLGIHVEDKAIPTVNLVPLRVSRPLETRILDLARRIQRDVCTVGSPVNAGVSLAEIKKWTGVEVDTFVNFLRLPDGGGIDAGGERARKGAARVVTVTPVVEWEGEGAVSRVVSTGVEDIGLGEEVLRLRSGNERVLGAYKFALDVEATVRNGALDVGVFAPEAMLGLEGAEVLVRDLEREMERLWAAGDEGDRGAGDC